MSYTAREKTTNDGHPLELYRFTMGAEQWLYTSCDHVVAYEQDEYQPVFITRGNFTKGGDTRKSTIDIEVSTSNPVALLFRTGWLAAPLIVTIFRHHYDDSDFSVLWKGRITGCKWSGSVATLTSDSVFTLFRRSGLRRVYQIGCPHVLFGDACGLARTSWGWSSTVASVSGNQLTVTGASSYPAGYFTGGMIQVGDEYRMITSHTENTVLMVDVVAGLAIGAAVTLWPGCPRNIGSCITKFNNVANFGGLPYLPSKNPFSGDALV